ncbi:MAG TPA: hypothetical protein VL402_04775 [Xanthobacteraceae bacterium]|jgi:2-methylcitrate dehydratase PrpD|nr:hypothetical protein [Xanthobacteraceae bacterium]
MLAFERPTIRGSHDATYGHDRSQGDPLLVDGLGARWETLTTAFKAFPCHVTAQAPVQALLDLKRQHAFGPLDVASFVLSTSEKVLSHHADPAPKDVATAQYSVPYSLALALFRDPSDPRAFLDGPDQNEDIITLSRRIVLKPNDGENARNDLACRLDIVLRDGRALTMSRRDFEGTTTSPLSRQRLREKFFFLSSLDTEHSQEIYNRLNRIEEWTVASLI